MKRTFTKITAMILALCICLFSLISCGDNGPKLTEEMIRSELVDSDGEMEGTLTITEGDAQNVKAFKYEVTGINAAKVQDQSVLKNAVDTLMSDPGKLTYNELRACNAFLAVLNVIAVFCGDDDFDSNALINDILSIICNGSTKTYDNWSVSASVDEDSDSIIVKAAK